MARTWTLASPMLALLVRYLTFRLKMTELEQRPLEATRDDLTVVYTLRDPNDDLILMIPAR